MVCQRDAAGNDTMTTTLSTARLGGLCAKTLRVHHLAKELGVPSKVIIAKCNAEGVEPPLKNHMAALSIGLAESIREWFSAGADVTTIEVATPVDLDRVKKKKARAKQAEAESPPEEEQTAVATQTLEREQTEPAGEQLTTSGPVEPAPDSGAASTLAEPEEGDEIGTIGTDDAAADTMETLAPRRQSRGDGPTPEESVEEAGIAAVVDVSPDSAAPADQDVDDGEPAGPAAAPQPPVPRDPVQPAGPKLVPKPAELKGPRVVRIEAPEPVALRAHATRARAPEAPCRRRRSPVCRTEPAAPRGRRAGASPKAIRATRVHAVPAVAVVPI